MKTRQDFVSNSSSSSYVVTGIDDIEILKNSIVEALSDERDQEEKYKWADELKRDNLRKLNQYLPDNTAFFYAEYLESPIGIPNHIIEEFCKDGVVTDGEKLKAFVVFCEKKYQQIMDTIDEEYEKALHDRFEFTYIAKVNENSIAILKWLKEHDLLWNRQRIIDRLQSHVDEGDITPRQMGECLKDIDKEEQNYWDSYNKIINAYEEGKPMIYVHINRDGDGEDSDKLFSLGYIGYAKEKGLKIICWESF